MCLQVFLVGQKPGIVKIFSPGRAIGNARLAFDTDAGHFVRIVRIDGAHGAHPGAGSAVGTFGQVRLGLGL